jgi:hypothetical protein
MTQMGLKKCGLRSAECGVGAEGEDRGWSGSKGGGGEVFSFKFSVFSGPKGSARNGYVVVRVAKHYKTRDLFTALT